jgi:hypothetical protein
MRDIISSEILVGSHHNEVARVLDTPICVVVEVHHDSGWIEFYPTSLVISIAKIKKSCMLFLVFPYEEHAIMKKIKEPNKYF